MSTISSQPTARDVELTTTRPGDRTDRNVRRSTETKAFVKTSEFMVWVLATAGVLLATYVKYGRRMTAWHGWQLITILAVGYMVSRGLAKAGSREHYTDRT